MKWPIVQLLVMEPPRSLLPAMDDPLQAPHHILPAEYDVGFKIMLKTIGVNVAGSHHALGVNQHRFGMIHSPRLQEIYSDPAARRLAGKQQIGKLHPSVL